MFLTDLLFPKFCLGCGYLGVYLCSACLDKLNPVTNDICFYCKKPSLYGLTHPNCINKLGIDGLIVVYHYSPLLKKIIKNIKYRLAVQVWNDFCKIITPDVISKLGFYKKTSSEFRIQPVPLSIIKYHERGFNQSSLFSYFFQKFIKFPIIDLLIRKNEKIAQAQIKNRKDRFRNIKGMFRINKKCRDKNIILVDDVITSGSTVKEATKILKEAGANKVYVLTLARG